MNKEKDGPAFPLDRDVVDVGMTLRDYFAAHAMQGIASIPLPTEATMHDVSPAYWIAENAYAIADAMMKAREQ